MGKLQTTAVVMSHATMKPADWIDSAGSYQDTSKQETASSPKKDTFE
jgi:hypothetical protein